MDRETLSGLKVWFGEYVKSFYTGGEDAYLDEHYLLKEKHTYRVCGIARRIAEGIGLEAGDVNLAEAIALLHDAGRFEQFRKYRTYKDDRSTNHCRLGVEVIREQGTLEHVEADERAIIEKAVEVHGMMVLPDGLDERTLTHCRLIRDADKADIYRVLAENFQRYYADPKTFPLEVEFKDEPRCSPEVIGKLRKKEPIDYRHLRTLLDAKLLTLGWIYDVNFKPSLEMIRADGWWEALAKFVPDTGEAGEIKAAMRRHLEGED